MFRNSSVVEHLPTGNRSLNFIPRHTPAEEENLGGTAFWDPWCSEQCVRSPAVPQLCLIIKKEREGKRRERWGGKLRRGIERRGGKEWKGEEIEGERRGGKRREGK